MTLEAFVEIYITDKKKRLRENTWSTKEHIIRTKILPYFKEKRLSEIKPRDVIAWQNEMLNYRDKNGKAYSPTYLKTLHGQLSAILNHAVRFYGLKSNAAATAGCMGSEKHKEMLFWTKEEYLKFAEAMMDKPQSYYAFEVLYWCGIREGELLALTPADFDLDKGLRSITKSYQRMKGRDVITDPKTPKSVRVIQMPQFQTDEIRDYLKSLYKVQPDQRIFEVTRTTCTTRSTGEPRQPEQSGYESTTCGTRMSSTRQKINLCKNRNTRLSNRLIVWYLHFCCY